MVPIQILMAAMVAGGSLLGQVLVGPRYWVAGAGLAMSASYLVGALAALVLLSRRLRGIDAGRVLRTYVRAALAAAVAGAGGWGVLHAIGGLPDAGPWLAGILCISIGASMAIVYGALLKLMRVRELDDMLRPLLRRLRRPA